MLRALGAILVLAPLTAAQGSGVVMNARIEPLTGPALCPGFEYRVEDTSILLLPVAGVDLGGHDGVVRLHGFLSPDPLCPVPVLVVQKVTFATATLVACGTPAPGCPVRLRLGPPALGQWSLWFSVEEQIFLDLGNPTGVWLLGPPFFFLGSGFFSGLDSGVVDVVVPPNPALVGLHVTFQGTHNDIGPVGPITLTNPERLTIVPATVVPCEQPDC